MVVISDHYDITKETMFDVTRLTSFLEKDASFLTPWSWDPKTSTKQNKYLSFHPESYFSYEEVIDASRKQKYVPDSEQKEDENKIIDGMTRKKAEIIFTSKVFSSTHVLQSSSNLFHDANAIAIAIATNSKSISSKKQK
ncbi:hypothetical protein TSUD_324120 [Trifolium subterraneum]|uniref:Uncharacterized protein n=1 Tax=Trifolium subterraneum TaxID=3900 RepID=A0A2Z6PFC2_TRISU|nr:hypothetical protein TSUD_324120 [Trifolium subterraneum]